MQSRSPWILMTVAAVLFAYIWFYERHEPNPTERSEAEQLIYPDLDPSVEAVTLVHSNATLRLEKRAGRWELQDPKYPAFGLLIDNWIESVAALRRRGYLTAGDLQSLPGGLSSLGLEPPWANVTLEQNDRRFQFRLGQRTVFGETLYLQEVGEAGVHITGVKALETLPSRVTDWLNPQLINLSGIRFDRMQLQSVPYAYEVVRDNQGGRWRLVKPRAARADHGHIEQMLQQLQAIQMAGVLLDTTGVDLEECGLQPPQATWSLAQGTNVVLTLEFGGSPTNRTDLIFVRRSHLPGLVVVPRVALALVAVPYGDLLDYRLVDRPVREIDRVAVVADEAFVLQQGTNGIWQIVEPLVMPTDPGLTARFLEDLSSLRVLEVVKEVVTELDLPTYGLEQPVRQYGLEWPAAEGGDAGPSPTLLGLDFGANRGDRVMVRRSDENSVYAVSLADALALPRAAYELRDRRIWSFTTNDVSGITIYRDGNTHQLLRSRGGQWSFAPGSQGMVNTFALEEALRRLGDLRARHWVARGAEVLERHGISQMDHRLSIDLNRGGQVETLSLRFGATSPSGGPFTATELEGEPTVFECPLDVYYPYDEVVRSMMPAPPAEQSP